MKVLQEDLHGNKNVYKKKCALYPKCNAKREYFLVCRSRIRVSLNLHVTYHVRFGKLLKLSVPPL